MKKILIGLCSLVAMSTYPLSYTDLKTELKEELYRRQKRLMGRDSYLKLIEGYLVEGEQALMIPQECLKLSDAQVAEDYFKALVYLNIAILYEYAHSSTHNQDKLKEHKKKVLAAIQQLKTALQLDMLNPNVELQKTVALFTKANKAYYKKLNLVKRGLLMIAAKK